MTINWKSSWVVGGLAVVVIVLCGIWLWKMPRDSRRTSNMPPVPPNVMRVGSAVGYQAGEETARICGAGGGTVVLVVPTPEVAWRPDQSLCTSLKDGFQESSKQHTSIRLAGVSTLDPYALNLARLQDIRKIYPQATVIVSFIQLPQLSESEQQTWLESNPPKLIAVEFSSQPDPAQVKLATTELAKGVVEAVIMFNQPSYDMFLNPPESRDEILKYYDILRRP